MIFKLDKTMDVLNVNVLSEIISYLDITEDEEILEQIKTIYKLTDNETCVIKSHWMKNSKVTSITEQYINNLKIPSTIEAVVTRWFVNNKAHRDGDLPAVEYKNGGKVWYKNGKQHRDGDKPAFIGLDDTFAWYKNGKIHRDGDLPAVEWPNGDKEWYKNGRHHRDGDKPVVIRASGTKEWYKNGNLHRGKGLPAVIRENGKKEWHVNIRELGKK